MKKIFTITMALALMLVFTACGSEKSSATETQAETLVKEETQPQTVPEPETPDSLFVLDSITVDSGNPETPPLVITYRTESVRKNAIGLYEVSSVEKDATGDEKKMWFIYTSDGIYFMCNTLKKDGTVLTAYDGDDYDIEEAEIYTPGIVRREGNTLYHEKGSSIEYILAEDGLPVKIIMTHAEGNITGEILYDDHHCVTDVINYNPDGTVFLSYHYTYKTVPIPQN